MALGRSEPEGTSRAWTSWASVPVIVALAATAAGVWWMSAGRDSVTGVDAPASSGSASAAAAAPLPPRCVEISAEPFMIGDAPRPAAASGSAGGVAADPGDEIEDPTAPFAVEIGRGAVFDGGFAAGARREAEGGAVAMVATLGADGKGGQLVRLGRSRGDFDPPMVAGAGASVLAVLTEPNAGGRAIKVAKVTAHPGGRPGAPSDAAHPGGRPGAPSDAEVTWGPEFSEGRDESLAVDVAASGARAVVVWDDIVGATDAERRSSVMLASLDVATMRALTPAHAVSAKGTDASMPRLVTRPGGYWLGYLAHGDEDAKKNTKNDAKKKARPRPKHDDDDVDESEDEGESIGASWIEVVPLDEGGAPSGAARSITPKGGHVRSFDLELGENGSALLAWRDDDTPTGSSGGKVSAMRVGLGGGGDPRVLVEEAGGAGAPDLLPGWISLASVNGPTRIAAIGPDGALLDELAPEPSLGAGEPIAATGDAILWARPMGKAMRLAVVRCRPRTAADAGP